MRRRLTITVVLLTVGTLVVSGVVTLLLTVHTARLQTEREVTREATELAGAVRSEATADTLGLRAARLRRILATLRRPLRLQGSAVVTINPDGTLGLRTATGAPQALPDGVVAADLDVAALIAGETVSGIVNDLVFAAAPLTLNYRIGARELVARDVVVLVRRAPSGLGPSLLWLAASSAGVLVVAVVVADRLARRTVRPLRTAEAVTARITSGDLSARVDADEGADPEVRNLGSSINTMAEALAAARGTQRQFLLAVSHELRTPLTSIRGFAEAIEDGTATDVGRAAGIIGTESRRLDRLVSDLLELARLDTGRFSLQMLPVRLSTIVADAVAAFEPGATELGLLLDTTVEGATLDVLVDPDRVTQVISNLVENALNYATSTVGIGASTAAGAAVLWVDDDGPGVAAEDRPHIFTRLFSSSERPGRRVGSGLGLAIVAELVGAMGGTVRAEAPPGGKPGTRVVVTLRLAPRPAVET